MASYSSHLQQAWSKSSRDRWSNDSLSTNQSAPWSLNDGRPQNVDVINGALRNLAGDGR